MNAATVLPAVARLSPRRRLVAIALIVAWVAVVARAVTALLFLEMRDQPVVVAIGLAGIGLLTLAVRTALRPGHRIVPDGATVVWLGTLLLLLGLFHTQSMGVGSDGRDYFLQARTIVVDRDLVVSPDEIAEFGGTRLAPWYPIGTALLWTPFVAAAHAWLGVLNLLGGDHDRTGYSAPYQVAAGLATVTYGFVALILIARVLRSYFSARLALVSTLLICFGSFIVWYLVIEPSMTHGASMFAVTVFLYAWYRTRADRTWRQWIGLGALVGLMALVRWQDTLFAVVPGLEAAGAYALLVVRRRWDRIGSLLARHAAFVAAAGLVFLPQIALWSANVPDNTPLTRRFGVDWFSFQAGHVLFSPHHGLFTWTPLCALAVIGLVVFLRRDPRVAMLLGVAFLAQAYANGILVVWTGGAAFGARRFASSALIFAIGLASVIDWARVRPMAAMSVIVAPLLLLNVFVMQDFRGGRPLASGLTAPQLWNSFYQRLGNPFSFPANARFAAEHGVSPAIYDRLGEQLFNTLTLDVGEPDDDRFLTYGWGGREREPGFSYRWSIGQHAGLVVPIGRIGDYTLRFRAEPFGDPAATEPATVGVTVNGTHLDTLTLEPHLRDYVVVLPGDVMQPYLNHIRFTFTRVVSPKARGLSDDARELGVAFDYIEVARQPDAR